MSELESTTPSHDQPGKMIDIGGYKLHLYCIGSGKPTILLEAGLGWSEAGPLPRTAHKVVQELAILLENSPLSPEGRENHGVLRARTSAMEALWSEWKNTCTMQEAVRESALLRRNLPLEVLSAENRPAKADADLIREAHQEMALLSDIGKFVLAPTSGHWIQLNQPNLVIESVRRVAEKANDK